MFKVAQDDMVLLRPIMEKENEFSDEKKTNKCIIVRLSDNLDQQLRNKCVIVADGLIQMNSKYVEVEGEQLILTGYVDVVGIID